MTYRDLEVWQRAIDLTEDVYRLCAQLPPDEKFGLSSQLKRAAASIPANIAEGQQRNNLGEYLHFIGIARASAAELETHLEIVARVYKDVHQEKVRSDLEVIRKMLSSLRSKLQPKTHHLAPN